MNRKALRGKHRQPPKVPPPTTPKMTETLSLGERIQVRKCGERGWRDHVVRRTVEFRTTGRRGTWLYGEYLYYEIRKAVSATAKREARY